MSSVAIPTIIALVGWWVQSSLSTEGIKKDYVQMAIGVLKDADTQGDEELRKWAVAVLDQNSPIPFSKDLREKLVKGTVSYIFGLPFPELPKQLMEPPLQLIRPNLSNNPTMEELTILLLEDYGRGSRNTLQLESLQEWLTVVKSIDDKYRSKASKNP